MKRNDEIRAATAQLLAANPQGITTAEIAASLGRVAARARQLLSEVDHVRIQRGGQVYYTAPQHEQAMRDARSSTPRVRVQPERAWGKSDWTPPPFVPVSVWHLAEAA